ncbi:DnaD domain protein [Tetragenococcus halophilus]|uniref:DnaB/C C-terminal domain-containing protein n=1 Tax=Tetragenococcus halophilus (strain DSM 20338 / JCM 20259 / NCIMB 9735 / NBRC 12172) TaxID=945021 RepID=A0AAN1SGL1_TETHN|nr:DnaD domain protein [Tetragenococcus halophilus]BAK94166.1 hypothetical protein TEH_08390 [Tetragenococcus halophilus NBRC 12172]GBD70786.1 putative uncharacterized protein [Tetragenococcus halophilus subsp. halophilus]
MAKIEKIYDERFTRISNDLVQDEKLSWKARGIFAYLWSMPDDWEFYETEVSKHSIDGRGALRSGLIELEEAGYLTRERKRNEKGQLSTSVWKMADKAIFKPMSDFQTQENPTQENQTLQTTNELTTDFTNVVVVEEYPAELIQKLYGAFPSSLLQSALAKWLQVWPREMVSFAIQIAYDEFIELKKLGKYVQGILNNWQRSGIDSVEKAKEANERFKNSHQNHNNKNKQNKRPKKPKNNDIYF